MHGTSVPTGDPRPVGLKENGSGDGLGPLETGALALGFFAGLPSALYLGWHHATAPGS